jgi:hypothetical protein
MGRITGSGGVSSVGNDQLGFLEKKLALQFSLAGLYRMQYLWTLMSCDQRMWRGVSCCKVWKYCRDWWLLKIVNGLFAASQVRPPRPHRFHYCQAFLVWSAIVALQRRELAQPEGYWMRPVPMLLREQAGDGKA